MSHAILQQLCDLRGIQSDFVDAWGNPAKVSDESKIKMLAAMGYAVDDEAKLAEQLGETLRATWGRMLPPVVVVREGHSLPLVISVARDNLAVPVQFVIKLENGGQLKGAVTPLDGELLDSAEVDGVTYQKARVHLHLQVATGYHRIQLKDAAGKKAVDSRLVVAPQACYKPEPIARGKRTWGTSVQLYCLRSERNWGVGDFTDLYDLVEKVAAGGGDFVGLNPIHALYPNNPESASPYSPSSRRWLNVIYIDVEAVPEFAKSAAAKALVADAAFQGRLAALREVGAVDYTGTTAAKLEALRLVYATFREQELAADSSRAQAFKAFVEAGGESLREQALYDALQEEFVRKGLDAWGWPAWPSEFSEYHKPAVKKWAKANADKVEFYLYLQFLADEQLALVDAHAKKLGMALGIYRDLAVGVSEGSTEIWANRDLYSPDASVGAPPDILGPLGQNWGLPPMNPIKLVEQEYQPMVDLFRANMKSCGALRIDHVMALLRLWWVPRGANAGAGAYVYYDVDALLGLLALESQRNNCLIIGEDLGTVPDGIQEKLAENGVHSYRVFFFETSKADGGYISPRDYPLQAMATLTTHDMPTLIGFWHCDDLRFGRELGVYPDEQVLQGLYKGRHESKQKILDTLHGHRSIPDHISRDVNWVGMTRELNHGMQLHMAKGSSSLLSLQLEDWLEMDKPVNIPGLPEVGSGYDMWRRKLSRNLSELFGQEHIQALMKRLTDARAEASR